MRVSLSLIAVLVLAGCVPLRPRIATPPQPERHVVEVPALVGLNPSQAFRRIGEAGLCLGEIDVVEGRFTQVRVVDQDPQAATVVVSRSTVAVRFGTPKGAVIGEPSRRNDCATRE